MANNRRLLAILMSGAATLLSAAQADAQDVVMRRPLPQQGTGPDSQPVTPTPTPAATCADAGECLSTDPAVNPDPIPDPGPGDGVYEWAYGPWTGDAQCGQQTTLTREIGCVRYTQFGDAGSQFGMNATGGADVLPASYSPGAGKLDDGVYDPDSSDVMAHLAQLDDGGSGFKKTAVPISYCQQALGPEPVNKYVGKKAGCGYHATVTGMGAITVPSGEFVGCSEDGSYAPIISCQDDDGDTVDPSYCINDLESGGRYQFDLVSQPYSDTSSCTYGWYGESAGFGCEYGSSQLEANPDPTHEWGGPNNVVEFDYVCMRQDGSVVRSGSVEEASCAADDRPMDGLRVVGSCVATVTGTATDGAPFKTWDLDPNDPRNFPASGNYDDDRRPTPHSMTHSAG